MSSTQRIVISLVAVVILAGGFVLAQGSDDDDKDDAAQSTQTAPAPEPAGTTDEAEAPATTAAAPPPPRVETIRIKGGGPVGDPKTLEFDSGDTVRLRFRSDVAEEVHIHGYDKYVDVPAGGTATTRFEANAEGVFEIESHGSGELLAKLQVEP